MGTTTTPWSRAATAARTGLTAGLKTSLYLLRIMVPVSLAVALLRWSGALGWAAGILAPAMGLLGLPGEGAMVLVSAAALNVYSAVAVIEGLSLSPREITILAIMCLSAHNLFVETAVMKSSGSSATKMVLLRVGTAVALAAVLNLLLPASRAGEAAAVAQAEAAFLPAMAAWGLSTLRLVVKIVLLVEAIMVGQRLLEEFGVMDLLSRLVAPAMRVLGLSRDASFLWIVVNAVGYAYGAGIIVDRVKEGKMKPQDADLFNHHAAVCHSLLEDTALFLAIGVPLFWITVPRLAAALVVVWFERIRRHRFRRSFRVGTA